MNEATTTTVSVSDVRPATTLLPEVAYDEDPEDDYERVMWTWLNPIPRRGRDEDLGQDNGRDDPCGPTVADLPSGLSKAPFRWNYLGRFFDMELLGGFVGVAQNPETLAVRPEIGWVVREARDAR
jgi:hypothetical protein